MAEKYSGIAAGKQMKASDVEAALDLKANASDMTSALATKENVSNKKTSISSTSDTEYPSSKAVASALALKETASNKKTTISSSSDTEYPTSKAVYTGLTAKANTSDMITALAAKENASNKKTTISSTSDTEYPTSKAVATALTAKANTGDVQAKLPVGTILMYGGTGWVNNSTLPGWYKCDGTNGTPNLVNKFLRGGENANFTTLGGADSQSVDVPLPKHHHKHTHDNHQGEFNCTYINAIDPSGVFTAYQNNSPELASNDIGGRVVMDAPHSYDATETGVANASITVNTVPSHYTVIYIMKMA
ncbi:MAG: hypothetical protein LBQ83_05615 [Candidatus Margulisbacteria bacterium]|jgi:hypothetical protein|nr:hypothetical protein [Candidatus Margulisiibacteriota bacterium]